MHTTSMKKFNQNKHKDLHVTRSTGKQNTVNRTQPFLDEAKQSLLNYSNAKLQTLQTLQNSQNSISPQSLILPAKQASQTSNQNSSNVKVICRFRPLNEKEKSFSKDLSINYLDDVQVEIKSKNEYNNFTFQFDRIFNMTTTQKELYDYAAKELVESVLDGYNATIFAYGQTASGKTYTMEGILDNPEKEGLIPRMVRHVFHNIMLSNSDIEYTVKVSIIEIYMEKIKDLINIKKENLHIREKDKEIYIEDLSEHYVSNEEDVLQLIKIGSENRTTSATFMNEKSSRSHTLVIMTLHQKNTKTLEAKTGKLYLVDLAGSEKIAKTGSTGLTLEEAKIINKSLTTLGMVINALTDGKSTHIPYRESKLTRVLTESLGGNAKTCLIITCSPSQYNESETLSTLRFGTRAKKIKNKPKINKEVTVPELKLQIEKLEKLLVLFNNRVNQLETYIKDNNLPIPDNCSTTTSETNVHNENESEMNDKDNDNMNQNELDLQMNEIQNKYGGTINKISLLDGNGSNYVEKLEEANMKIADLEAIIEQKEKMEEEFESKEKQYKMTINQLSNNLENLSSKEIIKKKLKIIDKKTLDELYSQLKSFILTKSTSKTSKEINNKIIEHLQHIVNGNYLSQKLSQEDKIKLSSRLRCETPNKFELLSNGNFVDYKSLSDSSVISNNVNEELLKSITSKNERISRLESDVKEYKEKLELFEKQLTPDEKNLHKKIYTLEKNLEQVNNMYHQLITQKSVLKIENQIFEKKLKKRNEKISTLVKENYGLVEQLKMRDDKIAYYQKNKNIAIPQVVKVLRGKGIQQHSQNSFTNNNNSNTTDSN